MPVDTVRLIIVEAELSLALEPFASGLLSAQAQDAVGLLDRLLGALRCRTTYFARVLCDAFTELDFSTQIKARMHTPLSRRLPLTHLVEWVLLDQRFFDRAFSRSMVVGTAVQASVSKLCELRLGSSFRFRAGSGSLTTDCGNQVLDFLIERIDSRFVLIVDLGHNILTSILFLFHNWTDSLSGTQSRFKSVRMKFGQLNIVKPTKIG